MTGWCYAFSKCVLWLIFRVGFGLEVRGEEHVPTRGGFVVASNHISFLDPPLIGAVCPRRVSFMARDTLFQQPLLGAYMRSVGVIPLRRGEADVGAVREAIARLRQGEGVAIFPEGGRQRSPTLGQAKRGVGLLAEEAQVPIVPALVRGTFEAWPPDAPRPRRAKIRVAFGPAIPYTRSSVSSPAEGGEAEARERHQRLADEVTRAWHLLAEQLGSPPSV